MELLVQFIEGVFYIWLVYNFSKVVDVTPKRYIDWSITTPTMLVTLILYLIYLKHRETENNNTSSLELFTLLKKNMNPITHILVLNWLMLLFGYLGEANIISTFLGVILGFIPFLIYFYLIYVNYATYTSKTGLYLFWYFFIFWSLYGIVAVLPYYIKNSFYNILDLFAKNFFGIFLSYIIITGNY
jgi:bacteriorhodopsin